MDAERTIHPKVMGKGLNNSGLAVHQDEIINTVVMYVQDSLRNELSYRDIILLVNSTPEAPVKATTSSCRATSTAADPGLFSSEERVDSLWGSYVARSAARRGYSCTVLQVEECQVTQVKMADRHSFNALQLGVGLRKAKNVTKPVLGHRAKRQL
ncbi:hypothetical protein PR002_g3317 [Phytophthora rubi]|uniref:Uncharacterized protein n=1 Tax=Phytophthora rubi TaxID=129364 RepID=A0A6A3NQI9_9STRA|nr:hypothetical protein PR002_g3317 [Phytophthora rubi]